MSARSSTIALVAALLVLPLQLASADQPASRPRIEALEARVDGDRVLASFRLVNGLGEETLERIHSGIPVTFKYRVNLLRRRGVPLMPAKELARTRLVTQVAYDSLTRQYSLLKTLEIKSKRKRSASPPQEQRRATQSLDEMRQWMTEFREVPVFNPERPLPESNLRLRVESNLGRRFVMWIFPATVGASAERRLER